MMFIILSLHLQSKSWQPKAHIVSHLPMEKGAASTIYNADLSKPRLGYSMRLFTYTSEVYFESSILKREAKRKKMLYIEKLPTTWKLMLTL